VVRTDPAELHIAADFSNDTKFDPFAVNARASPVIARKYCRPISACQRA